jgi:hypothetical protein
MTKQAQQLAECYKAVRDAVYGSRRVSNAERVAVLELVKAELINDAQVAINVSLAKQR